MSNPYYSNTGYPQFRAPGKSEDMRAELKRIEGGMDRLPDPIMPNQPVFGNASGTGMMMKDKESAKALLDLDKVDNTSDADKPISTETAAAISSISRSMVPVGTIIPYMGGYFTSGANGGFVSVWGNDAASLNARFNEDGWYVCDGAMLNLPGSPFFDGPNRYLPNLTDDRFIMGSTGAGALGGDNTMEHSHGMEHTHNTANFTLSNAEIPNHNHTEHPALWAQIAGTNFVASATAVNNQSNTKATGRNDLLTSSTGGGEAHNHGATSAASTDTTSLASYTENRPKFVSCFFLMRVI